MIPHSILIIFPLLQAVQQVLGGSNTSGTREPMFQIMAHLKNSCVVVLNETHPSYHDLSKRIRLSFADEESVWIISVPFTESNVLRWPLSGRHLLDGADNNSDTLLLYLPKYVKDRSCLYIPDNQFGKDYEPIAQFYQGGNEIDDIVSYINERCDCYRAVDGHLNVPGLHRDYILSNLFSVKKDNPLAKSLSEMISTHKDHCDGQDTCFKGMGTSSNADLISNLCPEINADVNLTSQSFFSDYLSQSKPVIIRGGVRSWSALTKWTVAYLRKRFSSKIVHIKLAENGIFEGVDEAAHWSNYPTFKIPDRVHKQLLYPDLVVVRPAVLNVNFSNFLNLMNSTADTNISTYLEYSSIPEYLPELEDDIEEPDFVKDNLRLERKHTNLWLSNGNTVGKLHFDPFDNLLCQIRGTKELILFEPHNNTQLYEGHIPEALLHFNGKTSRFEKRNLVDSTSMVMSPVDIEKADFSRFAEASLTFPIKCSLSEGDLLYLPSFWWHEVRSYPAHDERRNMAVNFWYEPFLKKDFPCSECPLYVNPFYRRLL